MILSMEKTMVTVVISELKSISRLKIFRKTGPWTITSEAHFSPFYCKTSHFPKQDVEKQKCTKWPQSDLELNCKKYPVCTEYLSLRPKFWPIVVYNQPFSRYTGAENQKCTEWPRNDLEHLPCNCQNYPVYTRCLPPLQMKWGQMNPVYAAYFPEAQIFI